MRLEKNMLLEGKVAKTNTYKCIFTQHLYSQTLKQIKYPYISGSEGYDNIALEVIGMLFKYPNGILGFTYKTNRRC